MPIRRSMVDHHLYIWIPRLISQHLIVGKLQGLVQLQPSGRPDSGRTTWFAQGESSLSGRARSEPRSSEPRTQRVSFGAAHEASLFRSRARSESLSEPRTQRVSFRAAHGASLFQSRARSESLSEPRTERVFERSKRPVAHNPRSGAQPPDSAALRARFSEPRTQRVSFRAAHEASLFQSRARSESSSAVSGEWRTTRGPAHNPLTPLRCVRVFQSRARSESLSEPRTKRVSFRAAHGASLFQSRARSESSSAVSGEWRTTR